MTVWIVALFLGAFFFIIYPFMTNWLGLEDISSEGVKITEKENVRLFKEQKTLFQQQLDRGEIDSQQYENLLLESKHLLLLNTQTGQNKLVGTASNGLWLLPILLLILPLIALLIYQEIGAGEDQKIASLIERQSFVGQKDTDQLQGNIQLIAALERRVSSRPDNVYYWVMLAQSAIANGNLIGASEYFAAALKVSPRDSFLLAQYAESLFLVDDSRFTDRVVSAVDAAFSADQSNHTVLGLKGIEAFVHGDPDLAISYWRRAQDQVDASGSIYIGLQAGIDRAQEFKARLGNGPEDDLIIEDPNSHKRSIKVEVSLSAEVPFTSDQVVFVAAVHDSGPPMPLAAKKIPAGQLPISIILSDEDAVMPGQELSSAKDIKLVARLSISGSATPQSGDWETTSKMIKLTEEIETVSLVIDQKRP
jgi:cytochrome c-type biogenesis protein CcmH